MLYHQDIDDQALRRAIKRGTILFGGNRRLKIYGTLQCHSGKRMKRENRVFFETSHEASAEGYRPCGHCMKEKYRQWICSDSQ